MQFLSKLHTNSILTGSLDSYCLVCDNYLRSEDEAFTHLEKPIHKKNLGMAAKVEKFLDDKIVKVKKGYYCPFCNILLATTTKVTIHISETNHIENKRSHITCIGNFIVAFDEIVITLDSWHGITDNTCIICDMEFDDYDGHSKDHMHMLKLIQNKCEFGDGFIYRKVDEDSFFCLICCGIFAMGEKFDHHESNNHKRLYGTGKDLKRKLPSLSEPEIKTVPHVPLKPENKNANAAAAVDKKVEVIKTESPSIVVKKINDIKTSTESKCKLGMELNVGNIKTKIESTQNSHCHLQTQTITQEKNNNTNAQKDFIVREEIYGKIVSRNNTPNKSEINGVIFDFTGKSVNNATNNITKGDPKNVLDRVEEFQKKGVNIDFTWEKARCKKCYENIPFNTTAIENHIELHNNKQNTQKIENGDVPKTYLMETKPVGDKKSEEVEKVKDTEPAKVEKLTKRQKKMNKKNKTVNNASNIKPVKDILDDKQEKQVEEKEHSHENQEISKNHQKNEVNGQLLQKENCAIRKQPLENNNFIEKLAKIEDKNNHEEPKKGEDFADKQPKEGQKFESNATKANLATIAKENQMEILPNKAFCPLCKVSTQLNTEEIIKHANLSSHKESSKNNITLNENSEKTLSQEFINSMICINSNLGTDLIINDKYLVKQTSFNSIITNEADYVCMLCYSGLETAQHLMEHINSDEHKKKLCCAKVVMSLQDEFVRELNTNTYHCGYCNQVVDTWTSMQDHLSSLMHSYAKRHALWGLEQYNLYPLNAKTFKVSSMMSFNYA